MRKLLIGVAAAVAALAAIVLVLPLLVPSGLIKARIAALVQDRIGRPLRIAGDVSLSLVPQFRIVAHDVALPSPAGTFSTDLLQAQTVDLSLDPLALLRGAIEIKQLRIEHPALGLEIDKAGHRNWVFHRAARAEAPPATAGTAGVAPISGALTVIDGAASFLDQRRGRKRTVTGIGLTASLANPDGPLQVAGAALCNGEIVRFALNAASPYAWRDGGASPAVVTVHSARGTLAFDGRIGGRGKTAGTVSIKLPSLRDFLVWADFPAAARGRGLGELSIDGRLETDGSRIALSDLKLALDAMHATGALTVDRHGARPALAGRLDIDRLDLNPYLRARQAAPAPNSAPPSPPPRAAAPAAPATAGPAAPPAPSPPWSEAAIDLAPLKIADADLTLAATSVRVRSAEIGKSTAALRLKDGRLEIELGEITLGNGKGTGKLVADGSGATPAFGVRLNLAGVTVTGLPVGVAGIEDLSGTGNIDAEIIGSGRNPREIVASLNGIAGLALANGTIGSAGLSPLMRQTLGPAVNEHAVPRQIDYRSLSATATIDHGVLRNNDLKLAGPRMSATGAGTLDLRARLIDYLWRPVIAGLGSARIAVTGNWAAPAYKALEVMIDKGAGAENPGRPAPRRRP